MQLDSIEPEQQILAECTARHLGGEIGIGRRDQSHIDFHRARRTDPFEFAILKHTQQLGLLGNRDIGDLIEEQSAAIGQLETPDAIGLGIGERTAHMAEHLGLEHTFGNATHIDLDETRLGTF